MSFEVLTIQAPIIAAGGTMAMILAIDIFQPPESVSVASDLSSWFVTMFLVGVILCVQLYLQIKKLSTNIYSKWTSVYFQFMLVIDTTYLRVLYSPSFCICKQRCKTDSHHARTLLDRSVRALNKVITEYCGSLPTAIVHSHELHPIARW